MSLSFRVSLSLPQIVYTLSEVLQGYGLTETSPSTHVITIETFRSKAGSIGPLLPNLEARLVNNDINEAREGESGELWIRGPTIMKVHFTILSGIVVGSHDIYFRVT